MLLRSRIYDWLNHLVGQPQAVKTGEYERPQQIFTRFTRPFLEKHAQHFSGTILVVGCGSGVEIGWIAARAKHVTAVDVDREAVAKAKRENAELRNVSWHCLSDRLPLDDASIDTIFMHDVCEHIIDLEYWFGEYHRILRNDGIFINKFAPLFYSAYGAHLVDALKLPWGHLLFGLRAVVELRNLYYPCTIAPQSWAELGLNRLTKGRYLRLIKTSGFASQDFSYRTSMNIPLGWVPILRNLFIVEIEDILLKHPK